MLIGHPYNGFGIEKLGYILILHICARNQGIKTKDARSPSTYECLHAASSLLFQLRPLHSDTNCVLLLGAEGETVRTKKVDPVFIAGFIQRLPRSRSHAIYGSESSINW
jgi:hypothetical protein